MLTTKLSLASVVVAAPEQVSCELNKETVVLSLADSLYFGLDAVGTRIWEIIHSPTTIGTVRDAILSEYDVDADQCESDLAGLLEELSRHRLIVIESPEG